MNPDNRDARTRWYLLSIAAAAALTALLILVVLDGSRIVATTVGAQ